MTTENDSSKQEASSTALAGSEALDVSAASNRRFVEVARLELSEVTLVIYELDGAIEIQSRFGVKIDAERWASNAVRLNLLCGISPMPGQKRYENLTS